LTSPPVPDLGSNRRLAATAALVTAFVWAVLAFRWGDITQSLGDTDDAMRLARVRDLLAGQAWYDQTIVRLQPPHGNYMHWSRLVDGGLAALDSTVALFVSGQAAEWAMRFAWPLLWIAPAVAAALVLARRLGGGAAVFVCAVLMVLDVQLYVQFRPGRIDHHSIQITMALVAVACAVTANVRARWAALAGLASGIGLAVGVEALAFHALVGASFALQAALSPARARQARAYGLTIASSIVALYLIQTPPAAWLAPFCDALGWNLAATVFVAGVGLALVGGVRGPLWVRLVLTGLVGLAAATVYLAIAPQCIHGPFAAVDPRLRRFWMDRIAELQSWSGMMRINREAALTSMVIVAASWTAATSLLASRWRQSDPAVLLIAGLVAVAGLAASQAYRMDDYVFWFGVPTLAAALGGLVRRRLGGRRIGALAAGYLLSPMVISFAVARLFDLAAPPARAAPPNMNACAETSAYAPLAALPAGVVLAPVDLGAYILALTPDSVLAAPYHRMTWGILAAHDALDSPAAAGETKVRALNVRYVVDCPGDPSGGPPASLAADLRGGRVPPWLRLRSRPGQTLAIYQVEPAAAVR
jgi:hypothetical protein